MTQHISAADRWISNPNHHHFLNLTKQIVVPKHNCALGGSQTNQQVKTDQNTVLWYLPHCHTSKLSKGGHYCSTAARLTTDVNIWSICTSRTTEQKISSAHTLVFKILNTKELVFNHVWVTGSFPLENSPFDPGNRSSIAFTFNLCLIENERHVFNGHPQRCREQESEWANHVMWRKQPVTDVSVSRELQTNFTWNISRLY